MSVTAAAVINTVRDLIPDPVYSAGAAQPDTDGNLFRAQTLYRWLNDGIKRAAELTGWVVNDWFALNVTASIPSYAVDAKWHNVELAYKDNWRLARVDEQWIIWPTAVTASKSLWFATHRVTDHWEVTLFPTPTVTDPTTTLTNTIAASGVDPITVGSTTGFLAQGFVQIDNELIRYYTITSTTIGAIQRGVAGTTAATHTAGATVTHLSCMVRGNRAPGEVTVSTSTLEMPPSFLVPLQDYVLGRCRQSEQEHAEGDRLLKDFDRHCAAIRADPKWQNNQGMQITAYGQPVMGPLAYGIFVVP